MTSLRSAGTERIKQTNNKEEILGERCSENYIFYWD
jgi:hypothetical protein